MKLLNEDVKLLKRFFQLTDEASIRCAKKAIFPLSFVKNKKQNYYFINNFVFYF